MKSAKKSIATNNRTALVCCRRRRLQPALGYWNGLRFSSFNPASTSWA
jgi:hypothetical protein